MYLIYFFKKIYILNKYYLSVLDILRWLKDNILLFEFYLFILLVT